MRVNTTYNTPIEKTICAGSSYDFNGRILTSAGTYVDSLHTENGCDSIITLTLRVNPTYNTPIEKTICAGSSLDCNTRILTNERTYVVSFHTENGSVRIITLTLRINPTYNTPKENTIRSVR